MIGFAKVEEQFNAVKQSPYLFPKTIPTILLLQRNVNHSIYPKPGSEWSSTRRPSAYKFGQQINAKLNAEIQSWCIYGASNDKNAFDMFCVAKRDQPDKPRFVTDWRLRNLAIYKKQTPLANINELMEEIAAYPVWSKIDLVDVYNNIRVEESLEKWNTVLTTHGKMRSQVMSQGDYNTPGTMMEAMLDIFKDVVYQCLVICIEDIIIYSRTYGEHARDLKTVLQGLEEQKFYFKESKCQFFTRKLETLGHILTSDGLHVDLKKQKTILEFPTPTPQKYLRGFLGVVNYLQRFQPGLACDASTKLELQGEYIK